MHASGAASRQRLTAVPPGLPAISPEESAVEPHPRDAAVGATAEQTTGTAPALTVQQLQADVAAAEALVRSSAAALVSLSSGVGSRSTVPAVDTPSAVAATPAERIHEAELQLAALHASVRLSELQVQLQREQNRALELQLAAGRSAASRRVSHSSGHSDARKPL